MMGDIVSLRLHRKRKVRAAKEDGAAANRAKFGRARDERELSEAEQRLAAWRLDEHERED